MPFQKPGNAFSHKTGLGQCPSLDGLALPVCRTKAELGGRSYQDKWCYLVSTTQFGLKQVGIEQFSNGIMSRVCVYSMTLPVSVPLITLSQNSLSV